MVDSNDHPGTEPDFIAHTRIAEELRAPGAFRTFGLCLVGAVFFAFLLMLALAVTLKGWSQWPSVYLRPTTWLLVALSASLSAPLANWYLKARAIQATAGEQSCMLIASRAVAASFFLIGILAIGNT